MRGHAHLMGSFVGADSPLHRMPLRFKAPLCLLLPVVALAAAAPVLTAASVTLTALAFPLAARLSPIHVVRAVRPLWPVLLILGVYQWLINGPPMAFAVVGNIVVCVLAARLLTITTQGQDLLDGLVTLVRPFRMFGADPERFGLTLALMVRSIPWLAGSIHDVRDAAKARGLERNPRALVVPVVVGAVAYAHQTGDALAARGLGQPDEDS